jgi:shikimate dehydrogenase
MHTAALAQLGLDGWTYQRLPVPPELFAETVRALPAAGFAGANVTVPHKEAALVLADDATPRARAIGAANTLRFDGATIRADNTDAPGTLAAIGEPVAGRTALVLGAGGSARAVVWALLDAGAAAVHVWNRTVGRAAALTADLGGEVAEQHVATDILVNCTTVGLSPDAPTFKVLPLHADALREHDIVVDLAYRPDRPDGGELLAGARRAGCRTVDGLEVLVHQGALSLQAWTGRPAPLAVMARAARGTPSTP